MTKSPPRNRPFARSSDRQKKGPPPFVLDGPTWLWGHHAVEAALANPDRANRRIIATENAAERLTVPLGELKIERAEARAIDSMLPPGAVHQGLALQTEALEPWAIEDLIHAAPRRLVVLDQVSDPQNLGAIWRSAAAFGVGGIILQTRHCPPVTGVVAKAAAGAIERVPEARVVNIARALEKLADAGWNVVGLAGEAKLTIEQAMDERPVCIVMGAEGAGLREKVGEACTQLARIPIHKQMESLNVSAAAAIAFHEAVRAHGGAGLE